MSQIYELEEAMNSTELQSNTFTIDNDCTADWAIRQISGEYAELERLQRIAAAQIAEIEDRIKKEEERTASKTAFLKSCLNGFFRTVPHNETKTQETYKLLSGSLVMKKAKQKLEKDDAELLKYFRQNNMEEYIKVEEKPCWAEFKQNLQILGEDVIDTATGEIVPGIRVEEVPESFDIKC